MKNLNGSVQKVSSDARQSLARKLKVSVREAEVLLCVAEGESNKRIGVRLGISQFTVKTHLQRIFKRLDVHTRTAAAARAFAALGQRRLAR